MSEWISFQGVIEPMQWGKSVYTILRLPPDVDAALRAQGAKRVEGEFNDHPVNLALTTAPVIQGTFLWTGKSLLDETGLEPGERFDIRLRPVDPNHVDTPQDVTAALLRNGVTAAWDALTPGKKRSELHVIASAKRDTTRAKRIDALVRALT